MCFWDNSMFNSKSFKLILSFLISGGLIYWIYKSTNWQEVGTSFEAVKDRMNTIPADLKECLQPNMLHPSEIHPKRDLFEKEYASKGFEYVFYKYGEEGWRYKFNKIINKIKRTIGQ